MVRADAAPVQLSYLACAFARRVVPELERAGIREMRMPWGGALRLSDLRVIQMDMAPPLQTHVVELSQIVSEGCEN